MSEKDSSITRPRTVGEAFRRYLFGDEDNITLIDSTPLVFMHIMALGVFFVGFSWIALGACALTYSVRVFALTGGYHRYFSHNSYKTSRFVPVRTGLPRRHGGPARRRCGGRRTTATTTSTPTAERTFTPRT
jgi:hypothetical protein